MKAWRIAKHGGPEVLNRVDVADPVPGPMEVRVRVMALGLNHLDLWVRKGVPGHTFPLPMTLGTDVSGTIESLGPGSDAVLKQSGLAVGASVLINPGISCGSCEACFGGFDPLCPHYGIMGETQDGGCADFVVVPVQNLIALPRALSFAEAASLPIPFLTAWTMITRKAELRPGEVILIQAGGSGVSVAAIQIAKLLGGVVITTVGSDEKAKRAVALGADYVINYKTESMKEAVKRILTGLGKRGCDVVIDHVGVATWADSMKLLARGGRIVTCGATSGSEVKLDLKVVFFKNISILGSTMGSKADMLRVIELVGQKKLKPVVDSRFSMEDLPAAMERLEKREAFGKVIVECSYSGT